MAARIASKSARNIRRVGTLGIIGGAALIGVGSTVWAFVTRELRSEKITVAPDAAFLAGKPVQGPISAYAEAEIIRTHALKASEGKTYAELPQGDPVRAVVMNSSFLRSSLFTSVVSYGVSAFAIGSGALTAVFGWALRSGARED